LADDVDLPLRKPPEMVLIVSRRGVGRGYIYASRLGVAINGLAWTFVVARIVGRASVVRTRKVIGSGRVVVSVDEAAEVASTNQLFSLVLECFTFLSGVAVVSLIVAIFSHVRVGRNGRLAWWWDEVSL